MNDREGLFAGAISRERFLRDYWQRRPLLLRGAIDPARLDFAPEDLAGMACEEDIESRLVMLGADGDWTLEHGPFDESRFADLPQRNWTLLVQDVDKYVPQVSDLLDLFDFLSDWRIDDIMISYATDQGGVGPHTDNYDVFLVQAQGRRRWRLSERSYDDSDLLDDCPLRVLRHFETGDDWVLEPGDLLYLPPRLAHWGCAQGECVTWSVGMRGPADIELAQAWLDHRQQAGAQAHLSDNLGNKQRSWDLDAVEIARCAQLIRDTAPADDPGFQQWLGGYLTEPKPGFEIDPPAPLSAAQLLERLHRGSGLRRHPWARFAAMQHDSDTLMLCSQGRCIPLPVDQRPFLDLVAGQRRLPAQLLLQQVNQPQLLEWLGKLCQLGWLIIDE